MCVCACTELYAYIIITWLNLCVALEEELYKHDESLLPIQSTNTFDTAKHTGTKGIQGFKNSCYLDATLYGIFTFTDTFDILFLEEVTTNAEELNSQKRLKSDIVYPLRK